MKIVIKSEQFLVVNNLLYFGFDQVEFIDYGNTDEVPFNMLCRAGCLDGALDEIPPLVRFGSSGSIFNI